MPTNKFAVCLFRLVPSVAILMASVFTFAATPAPPLLCEGQNCESAPDGYQPYTIRGPIPSGWQQYINWPVEPNTGSTVTVSSASQLSSALRTGADIVLTGGNYGSLYISSGTADVTIRSSSPGAAVFSSMRIDGARIQIVGVRVNGPVDLTQGPSDVLFQNVHVTHGNGTQPTVYIGNRFNRVAFVSSTIVNTADAWPFLYAGGVGVVSRDFIVADCYINATTGSANNDALRMAHTSGLIFVDNWIESRPNNANQFRLHNEIENILLSNNILVGGATKLFMDIAGDGVGGGYARNFYAVENRMYESYLSSSDGPFTAMSNNGSISNASASNNNHYSASQGSGTSSMNRGPTPWVMYSNNTRRPYQSPPGRTQGASH